MPYRVNTVGKLSHIWKDGFRSFEIDVHIKNDEKSILEVGHHPEVMGDVSIEQFLNSVNFTKIQKILFDIKNISLENHQILLQRLDYLDKHFGIKQKLILEFQVLDPFVSVFSKNGYHSSYYLPTEDTLALYEQNNKDEMKLLASRIAHLVSNYQFAAISFDKRLYHFVEKHLQPLLTDDIVYHTWDKWIDLSDENMKKKLESSAYYQDERVKTILLPYKSDFDL